MAREESTTNVGGGSSLGSGSSLVKTVQNLSIHQVKIDVVKFDATINSGMLRCVVMNALNAQNLKDTIEAEEKPADIDKMV